MRLSFIRFAAAAFAIVVLVPNSAHAIVKTINFVATDLTITGDIISQLGLPQQDTVTGSFSFDTSATPFSSSSSATSIISNINFESFTVNYGPVTINAPMANNSGLDSIQINESLIGSTNAFSLLSASTFKPNPFGADFRQMFLSVFTDQSVGAVSLSSIQLLAILNNGYEQFLILDVFGGFRGPQLIYQSVTFSEVSAVPVPAALPLFGTSLALMGLIGWRKKRKAVLAT